MSHGYSNLMFLDFELIWTKRPDQQNQTKQTINQINSNYIPKLKLGNQAEQTQTMHLSNLCPNYSLDIGLINHLFTLQSIPCMVYRWRIIYQILYFCIFVFFFSFLNVRIHTRILHFSICVHKVFMNLNLS